MKRNLIIGLIAATTIIACSKAKETIDNLLTFEIPYKTPPFNIPKTGTVGQPLPDHPEISVSVPVPGSTNSAFGQYGTRADLVKEARVKGVNLTILNPENESFSFLKSVKLYVSDSLGNNEQLLAYKDSVPTTGDSLNLDVKSDVILDEYVKATRFTIRTAFTLRNGTADSLQVESNLIFGIKADPLP